jgi:integrase
MGEQGPRAEHARALTAFEGQWLMRGHVRKRGKKWSIVIDVGTDERGKRKQRWHSGFETKREAEIELTKLLGQLQTGTYVVPTRRSLGEFLELEWLPAIRHTIRPLTYESYERGCRNHLVPLLGNVPLQRLTPAQVNAAYAKLLRKLAPGTVRQVHAVLHRALEAAVRWGYVARNVADAADPPSPTRKRELRTWTADELGRFLATASDHRLYSLFVLLASTGARRGEALGCRWEDLHLDAGRWQIRRARVPGAREVVESEPKTAAGRRVVALDPATARVLREWRKAQLEERLAWGPAWTDSGHTFTREDGVPLTPRQASDAFAGIVKRSGLPRIGGIHALRHSWATLALQAGVHPKVVAERLGHASVRITLDTYSHVTAGMQEEAAATVAHLVGLD